VNWRRGLNDALVRATGFEIRRRGGRRRVRPPEATDRLLAAPAFVMCSVRSGSTLLRVLLDSHSQIHAPQELHLRDVKVTLATGYAERSLGEIGLDTRGLEHLLWDRVLHRELAESGKRILVNKTPSDVFIADRIAECWPDARFIFLLRHPLVILRSRHATRTQDSEERNLEVVLRYGKALEAARSAYPGLTVRY
jgi:Sulfotransferase family